LTTIDVTGLIANKVIAEIKTAVKENKIKKLKFDTPNVFKDKISLLFFSLIKTHIDERNKMNGSILIRILGIIIRDKVIGKIIPTS